MLNRREEVTVAKRIERGRRRFFGGWADGDGALAGQPRPRCALDYEREPEEEPAGAPGCSVGEALGGSTDQGPVQRKVSDWEGPLFCNLGFWENPVR